MQILHSVICVIFIFNYFRRFFLYYCQRFSGVCHLDYELKQFYFFILTYKPFIWFSLFILKHDAFMFLRLSWSLLYYVQHQTRGPPALAFQVLGFQKCCTLAGPRYSFLARTYCHIKFPIISVPLYEKYFVSQYCLFIIFLALHIICLDMKSCLFWISQFFFWCSLRLLDLLFTFCHIFNVLDSYLKHFYVPSFFILLLNISIKHVLSLFVLYDRCWIVWVFSYCLLSLRCLFLPSLNPTHLFLSQNKFAYDSTKGILYFNNTMFDLQHFF